MPTNKSAHAQTLQALHTLDSRLQHLELSALPTSWNPFAGMSKEEKAAFDELKANLDALKDTIQACQARVTHVESTAHLQSSHIVSLERQMADLMQRPAQPVMPPQPVMPAQPVMPLHQPNPLCRRSNQLCPRRNGISPLPATGLRPPFHRFHRLFLSSAGRSRHLKRPYPKKHRYQKSPRHRLRESYQRLLSCIRRLQRASGNLTRGC